MLRSMYVVFLVLIVATMAASTSWAASKKKAFTTEFGLEQCTFTPTGENPYFILKPGFVLTLEGEEDKELVNVVITVLDETFNIFGVTARVVEEVETIDGALAEISRNYFAICEETNSVVYFGEDVDNYEDGEIVNNDGSWHAGEDNALPGLIMPGTVLLGARYFQEIAPEVALDRAEVTSIAPCEVLGGTVENCLETLETTPLEPGAKDIKRYAPGVGLIQDGPLALIGVQSPD